MTSILRTRRSVHSSVSSLPSYIEHPAVCEDLPSLDDSTTSETEEDDYKIMECFPYRRNHEQELIARRRSFVVRALVLITILVLVATNVPSRANSQRAPIVQERRTTEFEENDSAEMAVRRLTLEAESVQSLQVFSNQEKIRKRSRRKVKKMFGDGPYLVEFELLIWDGENRAKQHFFTVEMAPVVRTNFLLQLGPESQPNCHSSSVSVLELNARQCPCLSPTSQAWAMERN